MRPSDGNEGCGVGVAGPLEGQEGVEVLQFDEEKVARLNTAGIHALDAVVDRVPVDEPLCEREPRTHTRGLWAVHYSAADEWLGAYGRRVMMTDRRQGLLAAGAAGVTVVLWASAFVAIRHVGHEFSAGALSLGRLVVGSLLLGVFVFTRPRRWPARGDWKLLLVCGLLWFGVYNVALNEAEQRLDAGTAAMLVNIGPLLIALLAGLLLGEGFPRQLVIGSIAAFGGVVLIGTSSSEGKAETWGVILCIAAAVAYAIGVVAQKPLLGRLPALEVTWLACTIGVISCLPFAPALVRETADARPSTIWWVVFLGAFPTALAFTTWAYALARTSAGRMGATTYLVPPLTIFLAWLLLDEAPAPLAFAGGALCLLGVAISRHKPKTRLASAPSRDGTVPAPD